MQKVVLVHLIFLVVLMLNNHIAAHCHQQRQHSLLYLFLDVGSLHQGGQQFNQLQSHPFYAKGFINELIFV